jgi:uncharacterized protein (TIGR02147 family)
VNMPDVFEYFDYRQFLRDLFEEKKRENRQFSHRAVLQKMGITSTGFLANVISGRKNLTQVQVQRLNQILKLKAGESRFFESLVLFNQAKSLEEKNGFMKRLVANQKVGTKPLARKQLNLFSKWYYVVLRELLYFHRLKDDFRSVSRMLLPPIGAEEAEKAVREMEELELLEKDAEGFYRQKDVSITTGDEIRSLQVANFQLDTMDLAKAALDRIPVEERDISCLTMTLSPESFSQVKTEIQAFRKRLAAIAFADEKVDQVFQCNIQFFPVTRKREAE